MREYENRESAERDSDLALQIIWECKHCKQQHEERPNENEGGRCACGGDYEAVGESYNG